MVSFLQAIFNEMVFPPYIAKPTLADKSCRKPCQIVHINSQIRAQDLTIADEAYIQGAQSLEIVNPHNTPMTFYQIPA